MYLHWSDKINTFQQQNKTNIPFIVYDYDCIGEGNNFYKKLNSPV